MVKLQRMGSSRHLLGGIKSDFLFFGDGPQHTGQMPSAITTHQDPGSPGSGRQIPDLNRTNLILSCWNIKIEKAKQRLNLQSTVTFMAGVQKEGIKTPAEIPRALVSSVQAPLVQFIIQLPVYGSINAFCHPLCQ